MQNSEDKKVEYQLRFIDSSLFKNSEKIIKVKVAPGSGIYEEILVGDDGVTLECIMGWNTGSFEYEIPAKNLIDLLSSKPFSEIGSKDLEDYEFELISVEDGNLDYKKVNDIEIEDEDEIIETLKGSKYQIDDEEDEDKYDLIREQMYDLYNRGDIYDSEYNFGSLFSLEFDDEELGSYFINWHYNDSENDDEPQKSKNLKNEIQLISFSMILMEFLDYTEKKSIDDLHQLMKHKIFNGDWELFRNCWESGLEKFDQLKEGIETYEEAFINIENQIKNFDSISEKQFTGFIELCVELFETFTDQIGFDGDEMKNKFELNSNHKHYNKFKFFQNLNKGFGNNMVYEKIYESIAKNKKIQFFIHIIKGNLSDSEICFTSGIESNEYMSRFKYFEDCFEDSSQVMSLNFLDALGTQALNLVINQIQRLKKENVSFFIQLGLVSDQKSILVFDDLIPRRNKSKGSRLKITNNFFTDSIVDSFKKEFFKTVENNDDSLCDFSIVENIEIICEPNFSKIKEIELQGKLKVLIYGTGSEFNQGFITKNDFEKWTKYNNEIMKTNPANQNNLWNQFCIDHLQKDGYWDISNVSSFTGLDFNKAHVEIYIDENVYFSGVISELILHHFKGDEIVNSKNVTKDFGNSFLPDEWDNFFKEESFNARNKKLVTTKTDENFNLSGEIDFKFPFDIKKFGLILVSSDEMGYGIDYGDFIKGFRYDDLDFYFEFPGGIGQIMTLNFN